MKKIFSFLQKQYFVLFLMTLFSAGAFAQTPVTYTVDKYSNELPSDASSVTINVYPANFGKDVEVTFIGTTSDIKITDSENNDLGYGTGSPVLGCDDEVGSKFTVNFDNSRVAADIAAAMADKICYMVSFQTGSLQYEKDGVNYTNKYPVTAYVYFFDAVDFTAVTPFWEICEEATYVTLEVTGVGHYGGSNYTSQIEVAEDALASVTGTDITGATVDVECPITKIGAGKFAIAFAPELCQSDASGYTVTVPAGAFSASKSVSEVIVKDLKVWAHVDFAAVDPEVVDPNTTFVVEVTTTVEDNHTIEEALAKTTTATVDILNADGSVYTTATIESVVGNTVTIEAAQEVVAGDYTIRFNEGAFSANLDKSPVLTCALTVMDVEWTYTPDEVQVNDATTDFQITVAASLDGEALDITNQTLYATIGSQVVSLTYVSTDSATKVNTYNVHFTPISADDELTIYSACFAADDSENPLKNIPIKVVPYVYYSIDTEEILIDTEDTSFSFEVTTKDKDGNILDRVLEYIGETDLAAATEKTAIAFNDGNASVKPVVTIAGNIVTVDWSTVGEGLPANNYQLNIPVGTLNTTANENSNKMFVNFRVMNHIEISVDPEFTNISTETESTTITLKGYDVEDEMDATINIKAAGITSLDILDEDGNVAQTADVTVEDNKLNLSFDGLDEGEYVVVIAPNTVSALASKNAELKYYIAVEDFEAEDVTINEQTLSFNVPVSDEAVTVLDDAEASIIYYDEMMTPVVTPVTIATSDVDGCVLITLPAALAKGEYALAIGEGAFIGTYANLYEDLACTVTVIKELYFVDGNNGTTWDAENGVFVTVNRTGAEETTVEVAPDVFDLVHYERAFTGTTKQAVSLPFEITADEVASANIAIDLYRIGFIEDFESTLKLVKIDGVKAQKSYANKPYVIQATAAGTVKIDMEDKAVVAPEVGSVTCSTTKTVFTFTTNVETLDGSILWKNTQNPEYHSVTEAGVDYWSPYVLSAGAFKQSNKILPWRWYMLFDGAYNEDYVKAIFDGEDVETAIDAIAVEGESSIYNVAGQKLNKAQKGINIVNGKKMLVK